MNLVEIAYILGIHPILESIEEAQKKLREADPEDVLLGYIKFGERTYKSVPEFLYLKGINFLYSELDIKDKLAKKYSKKECKTMQEATGNNEQVDILERYKSDLEKAIAGIKE